MSDAKYGVVAVVLVTASTVLIGSFALRFSRTTSDFYVASRSVSPVWNASAIGLPAGADALLAIRAKAFTDSKRTADAADLRAELIKLGVVVRDQGGKQYWRLASRPDELER